MGAQHPRALGKLNIRHQYLFLSRFFSCSPFPIFLSFSLSLAATFSLSFSPTYFSTPRPPLAVVAVAKKEVRRTNEPVAGRAGEGRWFAEVGRGRGWLSETLGPTNATAPLSFYNRKAHISQPVSPHA